MSNIKEDDGYRPKLEPFIQAMARHCRLLAREGQAMTPEKLIHMAEDMETAAALGGSMERRLWLIDEVAAASRRRAEQMAALHERARRGGKMQ